MISCQKCLALRLALRSFHVPVPPLRLTVQKYYFKSSVKCNVKLGIRSLVSSNVTCQESSPRKSVTTPTELLEATEEEASDIHHDEVFDISANPYISQVLDDSGHLPDVTVEGTPEPVLPIKEAKSKKESKKVAKKSKASQSEESKATDIEDAQGKEFLSEADQMKKEAAIRQSLKSYLSMCMRQHMVYKAALILKQYHKSEKYVMTSEVYDVMLKEAANQGNWKLIKEIVAMMQEKEVAFSCDSFVACFLCLGLRSQREKNLEPIAENLIDKMDACGYTVEALFKKCRFTGIQREFAVRGIRLAVPSFEPPVRPIDMDYISPLVARLNNRMVDEMIDSPATGLVNNELLRDFGFKQLQSEMSGVMDITSISNSSTTDHEAIKEMEQLEHSWEETIRQAVVRDLNVCKVKFSSANNRTVHIYPFLAALDTEDYVRILMQEVKMLSRTSDLFSPSMFVFCRNLGFRVMNEARLQRKRTNGQIDKFQSLYQEYLTWYLQPSRNGEFHNPRQMWQSLLMESQSYGADLDVEEVWWPGSVVQSVGQFLYNIILNNLKMKEGANRSAPAFYIVFRTKGLRTIREIKPHPHLVKLHQEMNKKKLSFDAALLPMLSPPLPWHGYKQGGYLVTSVPLVRLPPYASHQKVRLENSPSQQLYPAFDALNALGSIPWKINKSILQVAVEVFNNKGSKELDVPQPPSELPLPPSIDQNMTAAERAQVHKERAAYKRTKSEMYSLWCDTLYRLSLANHFKDTIFWLPHNMDFRGRVYPCSPHLTHLSHDMARSLLYFARGKPLGEKGFQWLKLHLVNLTGLKKREPVTERYRFAEEIMPEVLDSAERPLSGRRWWAGSDEPWQTLAACMEVAQALKCPEGPEAYVCHLPIHQDGSCNGLQHYAALGRDQVGAESVNLAPAERPQDVYSNVAILVERERAKDAANGVQIAQLLQGHISRKVIKQTVMTTVYGVTRFGARLQIIKQLKEIPELPQEFWQQGGSYLADKTFQSLQEMFTSAKEIQDWFTESAKLISTVVGENVEWITPLGLPVVQPYSKNPGDPNSRPNVMKQRNAFPPNFIHSLDSSHMMLTALFCQRQGTTFASIHDCFWTHPCTVDKMNRVCREQFVSLHSQPILEDLSKFMVSQFAENPSDFAVDESPRYLQKLRLHQILSEVPRRGLFDLRQVLDSVYFFS